MRRALTCSLLCLLLGAAGCGGGQIAGQDGATTAATQAAAPSSTSTETTATTATTPKARKRHRPRTTTSPVSTTTQPSSATSATSTTTTPSTTTPSTTATHTPKPKPTKPAANPGTPIDESAELTLVSKASSTEYTQSGTVTGTYDGTMTLTAKITNDGVRVDFTVTTSDGTVSGHGLALVHITGAELEPITGTAAITGGTGDFAGIHGTGLKVSGRVALDASRGKVHLAGTVFL